MTDPRRVDATEVAAEIARDLPAFQIAVNRYAYRGLAAQTFDAAVSSPSAPAETNVSQALNSVDAMRHDQARRAARRLIHHVHNAYTDLRRTVGLEPGTATTAALIARIHRYLASDAWLPRHTLKHVARQLNAARVAQQSQLVKPRQLQAQPCKVPYCDEPSAERRTTCDSCRGFHDRFGRHPNRAELDRRDRGQNMRIRADSIRR